MRDNPSAANTARNHAIASDFQPLPKNTTNEAQSQSVGYYTSTDRGAELRAIIASDLTPLCTMTTRTTDTQGWYCIHRAERIADNDIGKRRNSSGAQDAIKNQLAHSRASPNTSVISFSSDIQKIAQRGTTISQNITFYLEENDATTEPGDGNGENY